MSCEEARLLLDAHVDHELDLVADREMARHLSECERCRREVDEIRALKSVLRTDENYFRAPAALRHGIEELAGRTAGLNRTARPATGTARWRGRLSPIAIPAAIAAMVALLLMPRIFQRGDADFLTREIVAAHVRSTQVDHLTDVASTDRHTVKPWFEGKLDFSPPVADFQTEGFALVGGRVDYLDDRAVAALVYRHGHHVINVFLWPTDQTNRAPVLSMRNGYHLDHFIHAGMNYWIVSDMSGDEMEKLASLLIG